MNLPLAESKVALEAAADTPATTSFNVTDVFARLEKALKDPDMNHPRRNYKGEKFLRGASGRPING